MSKTIKLTDKGVEYVSEWIAYEHRSANLRSLRGKALSNTSFDLPVAWNDSGQLCHEWILEEDEYEYVD